MNDLDASTPLSDEEIAEIAKSAQRYKHQRGSQGRWARRWLRLYARLLAGDEQSDD